MNEANSPYTTDFYQGQSDGSYRSAKEVALVISEIIAFNSVLDVGCGIGTWLRAFSENGASKILGIDGAHVERSQLQIHESSFVSSDLKKIDSLPKGFDLVVCAEVLEHLPDKVGTRLIALMVQAAPVILFSAAIPGQGGTYHINERWHHHWHAKFERHGFRCLDIVRPRIFLNSEIDVCYRQNMFIYVNEGALSSTHALLLSLMKSESRVLVPIEYRTLSQFMSIRGLVWHLRKRIFQKLFG